jgi:4-amino-4-deoxy-L-arabinose transferase-like glycosyltransferase
MTSQPPGETTASSTQRIGSAILILATLYICYFSHLQVIGFVGPDEPRYAWIARDMAETGDWVTPRLYGKPWFEKPPLLYWGGAIFFRLIPNKPEVAARLPSAISALLATLALAWLAWRAHGEECARWLLLLLPTSFAMIGFSHAAATDMPFAGTLTIAMVCAALVLGLVRNDRTPILPYAPRLALLLFGFFLGLAVLAKGPAAIILSGGAVLFWAVFTKCWRDAFRLLHPASIASFCLTALPWYILCARRNPDFFRVFIIEHNFRRYLTPEFQHIQPFWYYIPILLIALFPWSIGILRLAKRLSTAPKEGARATSLFILATCWFLWPLLFFSVSQSKLPGYILPAIPPAVFGCVLRMFDEKPDSQSSRRIFVRVTGIAFMSAAVALVFFQNRIPNGQEISHAKWEISILVAFFVGGSVSILLAWRKSVALAASCCGVALLCALAGMYDGMRLFDRSYSARQVFEDARRRYPSFDPQDAAVFRVPRGIEFGLNYYFRRPLPSWSALDGSARWVFTSHSGVANLKDLGFQCPDYTVFPAAYPCENHASLDRLGGGGDAKQKE